MTFTVNEFDGNKAGTYWVAVRGFAGSQGTYTLEVTELQAGTPRPPPKKKVPPEIRVPNASAYELENTHIRFRVTLDKKWSER